MATGVKGARPMIKGQLAISEGKQTSESLHAVAIDVVDGARSRQRIAIG